MMRVSSKQRLLLVSIPSRGFWFFEDDLSLKWGDWDVMAIVFQSPRGDFGFLKVMTRTLSFCLLDSYRCFNPLAGILVF